MAEQNKRPVRLSTRARKKAMIQALQSTLGIISAACDSVGVDRRTHYKWMKSDSKYAESVQDVAERSLDFSEAALMKNIQAGKEASIFFHLKTKGKHRGYIETQHNLNTEIPKSDLDKMTNEELLAIINREV